MKNKEDFRTKLYSKYVSNFKNFIESDVTKSKSSDYTVFKKRYLNLLKDFPKDASIIDVGCGSGYMMQFLKENGYTNLYGIDVSEQQVERALLKGLNTEVKDIFEYFSQSSERFDIIFALDFVEHFHKDEIIELFSGLYNLLKPGGLLIVHTPNGQGFMAQKIIYGDLTHLTIFNPSSLMQVMLITGFINIRSYETGPIPKNLIGFFRVLIWKAIKLCVKIVRLAETGEAEKIITQDFICTARKK